MPKKQAANEIIETVEALDLPQQMQARCEYWQKVLRLQDWNIVVSIVSALEMDSPRAWGQNHWFSHEKVSKIKLVTPEDAAKQGGMVQYIPEETLVHELLHLHLASWETEGDLELAQMEFAINAIAHALFTLHMSSRA
jgi:hypothetical protein